jgi:hypothetical protein
MNVWLLVLGVTVVACAYTVDVGIRRARRRAGKPPSRWRLYERGIYAVLSVVSIVVGLKLVGAW